MRKGWFSKMPPRCWDRGSLVVRKIEDLDKKETMLNERLKQLQELEKDILKKEKAMKEKEKAKKQMLLRLSPRLWEEIAAWAEEDFRSVNGQVEYLLSECVRQRKKGKGEGNR